MYVDSNGIRVNYSLDGNQGSPWVTFITGIANDTTMWDGQIPALEDDFNILRLDTRGHGGTQATDGDYTFDMLMKDVGNGKDRRNGSGCGNHGATRVHR